MEKNEIKANGKVQGAKNRLFNGDSSSSKSYLLPLFPYMILLTSNIE
jgi:hypothetical protein